MKRAGTRLLLLVLCLLFFLSSSSMAEDRLVLPANLKRIEKDAFANTHADVVVFPDGIEYIDADAFSGISSGIGIGSADNKVAENWCISHGWTYQANTRYYALVIANSTYRNNNFCNNLPGVKKDGQAVKAALTAYGWNVRLVENRTASQMQSDIESYFGDKKSSDVCLLFYSGHGDNSYGASAGSLIGVDYGNSYDLFSPVSLRNTLLGSTKGKVIIMLDSCGSGATVYANGGKTQESSGNARNFTGGVMSAFSGYLANGVESNTGELLQNRFAVLAACEYGMTSQDGYFCMVNGNLTFRRGGTFTYSVLHSMGCSYPGGSFGGTITADSNNDSQLTLLEAYNGVRSTVTGMNSQLAANNDVAWYEGDDDNLAGWYRFDPIDQAVQMGGTGSTVLFSR